MSAAGTGWVAPPAPRLGEVLRAVTRDVFEHSWHLVVVNLAWGMATLVLLAALSLSIGGLLLLPLLAIPTSGVFRVAALIARGERVGSADGFRAWRAYAVRSLGLGLPLSLIVVVLATNVVMGLSTGELVGFALALVAAWGLLAATIASVVLWPLLVDPWREALPFREVVRLGLLLALAFPWRFLMLALVMGLVILLGSLAVVVILSLALGVAALIACRYVLPAADRFSAPPDRPPAEA